MSATVTIMLVGQLLGNGMCLEVTVEVILYAISVHGLKDMTL